MSINIVTEKEDKGYVMYVTFDGISDKVKKSRIEHNNAGQGSIDDIDVDFKQFDEVSDQEHVYLRDNNKAGPGSLGYMIAETDAIIEQATQSVENKTYK